MCGLYRLVICVQSMCRNHMPPMLENMVPIIVPTTKYIPNPPSTNNGSHLRPFIAEPLDIEDMIRLANPVIAMIAMSEKSWYCAGVIFGGLGFRNDMPVVGSPPGSTY